MDSTAEFHATVLVRNTARTSLELDIERETTNGNVKEGVKPIPRCGTTSVGALRIKILLGLQNCRSIRMLFALDRKPVIQVSFFFQLLDEGSPGIFAFAAVDERFGITDHNQNVACSGKQDIQTLGRCHKPYVPVSITSRQCCNYDVAFLTLIIVYIYSIRPEKRELEKRKYKIRTTHQS